MKFRHKKKPKREITLILEKEGAEEIITMKVGKKLGMLKIAKKLTSKGKQGWQLKEITGDPEFSGMFMGAINEFKSTEKVPVKRMVKDAGLSATPGFIKKMLKKDEKDQESS